MSLSGLCQDEGGNYYPCNDEGRTGTWSPGTTTYGTRPIEVITTYGTRPVSASDFYASITGGGSSESSGGVGTGAEQPEPLTLEEWVANNAKIAAQQREEQEKKQADLQAKYAKEHPQNALDKLLAVLGDGVTATTEAGKDLIRSLLAGVRKLPGGDAIADGIESTAGFVEGGQRSIIGNPLNPSLVGSVIYDNGVGGSKGSPPVIIGQTPGGTTIGATSGKKAIDAFINGMLGASSASDAVGGVLTGTVEDILGIPTPLAPSTLAETTCPDGLPKNADGGCTRTTDDTSKTNVTLSVNDQITKWFEDNFGASDKQVRDAMGNKVSVAQVAANRGVSEAEVQRRYNCADPAYAAGHYKECYGPSNTPVDDGRTGLPLECPKGQTRDASGKCVTQPPGGTGTQPPGGTGTQPPGGTGTQPPGTPPQPPTPPKPENPCPKGQTRNAAGTCVSAPPPEPECPKGQTRNAAGTCVSAPPPPPSKPKCPEGSEWVSNGPGVLDGKCVASPPQPPQLPQLPQPPQPPPPSSTGCSDPAYALLHPTECAPAPTTSTGDESYQQVTTTPGDLADIKYLYDVGGESIFAPNMSDYANEDDPITYLSPYSSRNTSPYNYYASGGKVSEYDIVTEALRLLRGD